jgi:hypothetical protein
MQNSNFDQQIYKRDPFFILLVQRLKVNQPAFIFAVSFLMLLINEAPILLGITTEAASATIGTYLLQSLVIFPLTLALYFETPKFISGLFTQLKTFIHEDDPSGQETYDEFLAQFIKTLNNPGWLVLELVIIAFYWVYRLTWNVQDDITLKILPNLRTIYRLVFLTLYTPLIYAGFQTLYRIILAAIYTGKQFREFRLQVDPISPDGAGGIGIVGRVLTISLLIATVVGVAVTVMTFLNLAGGGNPLERFEIVTLGIIYVVFLPLIFMNWLWFPHQAMLDARERVLQPLAYEFKLVSAQGISLKSETTEAIVARTERLTEIKRQYELIRDTFPVWPLQVQPLRSLLATSFLPAITSLLSKPIIQLWETIAAVLKTK